MSPSVSATSKLIMPVPCGRRGYSRDFHTSGWWGDLFPEGPWHSGAPEKEPRGAHNRVVCRTCAGEVGRLVTRVKHAALRDGSTSRRKEPGRLGSSASGEGKQRSRCGVVVPSTTVRPGGERTAGASRQPPRHHPQRLGDPALGPCSIVTLRDGMFSSFYSQADCQEPEAQAGMGELSLSAFRRS